MKKHFSVAEKFSLIANSCMVLIYFIAGMLLLMSNSKWFSGSVSKYLGSVLVLYSFFRLFTLIRKYRHPDEN